MNTNVVSLIKIANYLKDKKIRSDIIIAAQSSQKGDNFFELYKK